jgi:8-oxo-dGTP pyrophosphatase MutT (NUDIX family)
MGDLNRHIAACNNAVLPGERLPFRIGAVPAGWVRRDFAGALADFGSMSAGDDGVTLAAEAAGELETIARTLAYAGWFRWRGEAFDVRAEPGAPVLARVDRGALPAFGLMAEGVHVNGLMRRADGLGVWVARRAANKSLDPGKLDHLVAGGIPAGMTPMQTLIKEAAEEAAIPEELAARAVKVSEIAYAMERPEGLRRDLLHCYDLQLPDAFVPQAADQEVESFSLWPIERVLATVRDSDDFKFNVNLVLIDLFRRNGLA